MLSEIQIEKGRHCVVSFICGMIKKKSKTTNLELVETVEKRLLGDEGNKSFVEEYRLWVIRWIFKSEDPVYNMGIIVDNTVLYNWNR